MLSKYEQRCLIKIQIARGVMLYNAVQHYWKLVKERLYHIITWLGGRMHFAEGVRFRTSQAIVAAVEQSVRRSVQQDAVNGIRPLPDVWRWVLHVGGDCSKDVLFIVNSNVATIIIQ